MSRNSHFEGVEDLSRIIGYAGFGIAAVSLFLPAYKAPFVGNVSLLQSWQGWLLLLLLAAGVVATILNRALWSRIAGGLALGLAIVFLLLTAQNFNQIENQFRGLAGNMATNNLSFGFSWAWFPLIVGLVAVLFAPMAGKISKAN